MKTAINNYGYEVIGFRDGYKGLVENRFKKMTLSDASGLLDKGGTILGTTKRYDPFHVILPGKEDKSGTDMSDRIKENLAMHSIDCLVIIGGGSTIRYAAKLAKKGIPIVAIPKTVENDVYGTDITVGFMTAVNTATEAIDKLHSTAESNHRVMILEVMGLISGWIALESGIAGGADVILIPEVPYDINKVARAIFERKNAGKGFSIIVAAAGAGAKLKPGIEKNNTIYGTGIYHEGECSSLGAELEKLTSIEHRITVLGYLQRGGEPCPFDRILATRFGASAVKLVEKGEYNRMVCIEHQQVKSVPLDEVAGKARVVSENEELVHIARDMGVSFGD